MYRNSTRTPFYPCHDCTQTTRTNSTENGLARRGRSSSRDLGKTKSRSNNKLLRSPTRSKTRHKGCPVDQDMMGSAALSSRQRLNDVVLVNITDEHTASSKYNISQKKVTKSGSKCRKKGQKGSTSASVKGKTIIRTKHSVKENFPNNAGKNKRSVVISCSCKMNPNELTAQRNVEDSIKTSIQSPTEVDPFKNALLLTQQIQTNIDSIRAQTLPQGNFVTCTKRPQFGTNTAIITAPYLQQLKDEINVHRNKEYVSPCLTKTEQEMLNLQNEILHYRLKSDEDLPQAMVIEVSYIAGNEEGGNVNNHPIVSKKKPADYDMKADCLRECKTCLTDYGKIPERPANAPSVSNDNNIAEGPDNGQESRVTNNMPSIKTKVSRDKEEVSIDKWNDKHSNESILSGRTLPSQDYDTPKGIMNVSLAKREGKKQRSDKKTGTPFTEDGESTGHAIDELDADSVSNTPNEDAEANEPSYPSDTKDKQVRIKPIISGTYENTLLNVQMKPTDHDLSETDSILNESFLRDQIAGMQKIDKLVEEAEVSINKVVKGFDKYFKDPRSPVESVESNRIKVIEFNIDSTCDCPQVARCDCEEISEGSKDSADLRSEQSIDPPTSNSTYLNTISERTEASDPSDHEIRSILSENMSIVDKGPKKTRKISIDTRNVVNIPPTIEAVPNRQEMATETDCPDRCMQRRTLGVQNIPGVEIRPPFVVQKIYNISIDPTCSLSANNDTCPKNNALYIEVKHGNSKRVRKEPEITVLKAPNPYDTDEDSDVQISVHKIDQSCGQCKAPKGSEVAQGNTNDKIIDQLFDDIRDFQLPMVTATLDTNKNVEITNSIASAFSEYVEVQDDETQVTLKDSASNVSSVSSDDKKCCQKPLKKSCSAGTNTCPKRFPSNVRPPVPGLPLSEYQPNPYDKDEVDEKLLSTNQLEGSDEAPFHLSKTAAKDKIIVLRPMKACRNDDTQCLMATRKGSNEFVSDSASLTKMVLVKNAEVPDLSEMICHANASDFNAAYEDSSLGFNMTCSRNKSEAQISEEEEPLVLSVHPEFRHCSVAKASCKNLPADNQLEQDRNKVAFTSKDTEYSFSEYSGVSNGGSKNNLMVDTLDLEGVHFSQSLPPGGTNTTAMPVMVEHDLRGVAESLAQNLLLAQLRDSIPQTQTNFNYLKTPLVTYCDSTSSELSNMSSLDYPERHKYYMQAKKLRLPYQRGIITNDLAVYTPVLSENPDLEPLSDGEMSGCYSTGEVLGPQLLMDKNFMLRNPDKMFQRELANRNLKINRQYNYFNNWVSYYVEDSKCGKAKE